MADSYLKVKDNGANGLALVREESDVSVTELKSAYYKIPSLINGRFVRYTDGELGNANTYCYSDFIALSPAPTDTTLYFCGKIDSNAATSIAFYDSTKTFISAFRKWNDDVESCTIPSNAAYYRVSCLITSKQLAFVKYSIDNSQKCIYSRLDRFDETAETTEDLKKDTVKYGSINLLSLIKKPSAIASGITFAWDNQSDSCLVSGISTATANGIFFNDENNLIGLSPGKTYNIKYSATKAVLQIYYYIAGALSETGRVSLLTDGITTVPDGATGVLMRLQVANGTTVNETVQPVLFSAMRNPLIETELVNNNTYNFLDNIPQPANKTSAGVTYTWKDSECYVTNTSTGNSFANIVADTSTLPYWMETGEDYYFYIDSDKVSLAIFFYASGGSYISGGTFGGVVNGSEAPKFGKMTVPSTAVGFVARLQVASGVSTNVRVKPFIGKSLPAHLLSKPDLRIGTKYVAFGDSVWYGAVWTDSNIIRAIKEHQIPSRVANAIGMYGDFLNECVGGTGYCNPGSATTITAKVLAYDFTDVEVATFAGGVNDMNGYQLGTRNSVAGDGTICGAIKSIINYITTNYPRTQMIFVQPTPTGSPGDPWTTPLGGGWSLMDFITEVGALCASAHVTFIDLLDSVYINNWYSFSGGSGGGTGPNYSHFRISEDYARFGDFVAGKVSAHFHGGN